MEDRTDVTEDLEGPVKEAADELYRVLLDGDNDDFMRAVGNLIEATSKTALAKHITQQDTASGQCR